MAINLTLSVALEGFLNYKTATGKSPHTLANYRSTSKSSRCSSRIIRNLRPSPVLICSIHFSDLNLKVNSVRLRGKGSGRDGMERLTYFSKRTSQALWKYLLPRLETIRENEVVFVAGEASEQNELDRNALRKMLSRLGERAGVANVHPHRFRHTFAINCLRNGGDVFTLQALLGHSSLEMVKRYARVAQADCEASHRTSPVDNWKL